MKCECKTRGQFCGKDLYIKTKHMDDEIWFQMSWKLISLPNIDFVFCVCLMFIKNSVNSDWVVPNDMTKSEPQVFEDFDGSNFVLIFGTIGICLEILRKILKDSSSSFPELRLKVGNLRTRILKAWKFRTLMLKAENFRKRRLKAGKFRKPKLKASRKLLNTKP
jgi:hypothetical protein